MADELVDPKEVTKTCPICKLRYAWHDLDSSADLCRKCSNEFLIFYHQWFEGPEGAPQLQKRLRELKPENPEFLVLSDLGSELGQGFGPFEFEPTDRQRDMLKPGYFIPWDQNQILIVDGGPPPKKGLSLYRLWTQWWTGIGKEEVTIVLDKTKSRIRSIVGIRTAAGMGLAEAKWLTDSFPAILKRNMPIAEARLFAIQFAYATAMTDSDAHAILLRFE